MFWILIRFTSRSFRIFSNFTLHLFRSCIRFTSHLFKIFTCFNFRLFQISIRSFSYLFRISTRSNSHSFPIFFKFVVIFEIKKINEQNSFQLEKYIKKTTFLCLNTSIKINKTKNRYRHPHTRHTVNHHWVSNLSDLMKYADVYVHHTKFLLEKLLFFFPLQSLFFVHFFFHHTHMHVCAWM